MSISSETSLPDSLTRRVERALGLARVARTALRDNIIPNLSPLRRTSAVRAVRAIDRGELLDENMVQALEALIGFLEREVESGSHSGWQADDHHVRGGWETVHLDERASALQEGVSELRALRGAISSALDLIAAERKVLQIIATG